MSTSFGTHGDLAARPAAKVEERAAALPRLTGHERHPFSALPMGWAVVGRCRCGTGGPGPHATGCYALAHPQIGVALIDIAPDATPNAEARLRRALAATNFPSDFPGTLPVVHERVDGMALRSLGWVLERGFAALPALTVPGGAAWIDRIRRAMAADSAWELPGQPKAVPEAPLTPPGGGDGGASEAAEAAPRSKPASARRWGRAATLPLAFAGTFAVGLVSGFLLLDSRTTVAPQSPVVAAPTQAPAVAAAPEGPQRSAEAAATTAAAVPAAPPAEAQRQDAAAAAPASAPPVSAPPVAAAAAPAQPASAPPMAAIAPAQPASAQVAATAVPAQPSPRPAAPAVESQSAPAPLEVAAVERAAPGAAPATGGSAPPPSLETRLSHVAPMRGDALPTAPPRAPAAPPIRVSAAAQQPSRGAPAVDRACSQALFRFQQGERLTAAEQNFVRSGCSTSRR